MYNLSIIGKSPSIIGEVLGNSQKHSCLGKFSSIIDSCSTNPVNLKSVCSYALHNKSYLKH